MCVDNRQSVESVGAVTQNPRCVVSKVGWKFLTEVSPR
jgi:hypothetical protein